MTCDRCYQPDDHGEHGHGLCPLEPRRVGVALRPDSIPGGLEIAHGLCNADGTPRRYDSRSDIRREAQARGLVSWSEAHTEDSLKDARVYTDWRRSGEAQRMKADRDTQRREGTYRPAAAQAPAYKPNPERLREIRKIVVDRMRNA